MFLALLEAYEVESFDDLAATLASLEDCKDETEEEGGCQEDYELLNALYEVYPHVTGGVAGGVSEGPPTGFENFSGEPAVIQGGVSEGGVSRGPNFKTGRRGWTDIVPRNHY